LNNHILSWDSVSEKLGKSFKVGSTNNERYFEYSDLWSVGSSSLNLEDNKYYLRFTCKEIRDSSADYTDYGEIWAGVYTLSGGMLFGDFEVPVAITAIKTTRKVKGMKYKVSACWNTSDTKYSCKTFKASISNLITSVDLPYYTSMHDSPFQLEQYIVADKLQSNTQLMSDGKSANYLVQNFPIAYNLVTYEDTGKDNYPWLYENLENYFRVNPKKYAKHQAKEDSTYDTSVTGYYHYYCTAKPSSIVDVVGDATSQAKCRGPFTVDQFNNLNNDDRDEPFKGAFAYTHV